MTQVKFLIEKEHNPDFLPAVFAFFPTQIWDGKGNKASYSQIGQHSGCCIEYANECKEATYSQYNDLLRELIGQGYNDLQILNKQEFEVHRQPTKGEIKFGEGATHWLTVNFADVLDKEGNIKKWFVNPYDKLIYYTN